MRFLPLFVRQRLSIVRSRLLAPLINKLIIDSFHILWYWSPDTWKKNKYLGHPIEQLPLDMWLYQELIYEEKPPFILQTGVRFGGSILYFAHLLDLMDADPSVLVIGVDIELTPEARSITHPRVRLLEGSSTDPAIIEQIEKLLPAPGGMVSLDSDHSYRHVADELKLYPRFVGVGYHLVVEDTNVNGHPVFRSHGPGPLEATDEFLKTTTDFERNDALWKRNLYSHHQYGWLRRVK